MEKRRCGVCMKMFGKDEKPWGVRKIKGIWKTSPEFAEEGETVYHMDCATQVARHLNNPA